MYELIKETATRVFSDSVICLECATGNCRTLTFGPGFTFVDFRRIWHHQPLACWRPSLVTRNVNWAAEWTRSVGVRWSPKTWTRGVWVRRSLKTWTRGGWVRRSLKTRTRGGWVRRSLKTRTRGDGPPGNIHVINPLPAKYDYNRF